MHGDSMATPHTSLSQLANYESRYNSNSEPFLSNLNHWPYVRESQRQVRAAQSKTLHSLEMTFLP